MTQKLERPTRTVSEVRLANAVTAMRRADTLTEVVTAKDKAKNMGLLPKDTEKLKVEFMAAQARLKGKGNDNTRRN